MLHLGACIKAFISVIMNKVHVASCQHSQTPSAQTAESDQVQKYQRTHRCLLISSRDAVCDEDMICPTETFIPPKKLFKTPSCFFMDWMRCELCLLVTLWHQPHSLTAETCRGAQLPALLCLFFISHAGCGVMPGALGHVAPRRVPSCSDDLTRCISIAMMTVNQPAASVTACLTLHSCITRPSLVYPGTVCVQDWEKQMCGFKLEVVFINSFLKCA